MGTSSVRTLDRLKQPEYTGENRCMPCTTVNVFIAIILAVVLTVLGLPIVAGTVFVLSLAAIYFRGYLVPGTPTLTQRYFPDWLLAKFDKEPAEDVEAGATVEDVAVDTDAEPPESVVPEEWLVEHEVIVPCEDVDDLCLADGLSEAFHDGFERFREGDRTEQIASFLEVDADKLTVDEEGMRNVRYDGQFVARWRSDGPLIADLSAAALLEERVPEWQRLTPKQRSKIAGGLRVFADHCPLCEAPIEFDEQEQKSCCGRRSMRYTVGCEDCGETLLQYKESISSSE